MRHHAAITMPVTVAVLVLLGASCTSQRIQPPKHQLIPTRSTSGPAAVLACPLQVSSPTTSDRPLPPGLQPSASPGTGSTQRTSIPPTCAAPGTGTVSCPDASGWPAGSDRGQVARTFAGWQVRALETRRVVVTGAADRAATVVRLERGTEGAPALAAWLSRCAAPALLVGSRRDSYAVLTGAGWSQAERATVAGLLG
ncbi:hypothetical protein [Arsenicicoccus dermatophilus]|uniref:hypothetical protein n=1 Tax=Arsenicicoccus dermatophilus TaxID=1076331 RepID=UPI0039176212